jgi:hypothetical protein
MPARNRPVLPSRARRAAAALLAVVAAAAAGGAPAEAGTYAVHACASDGVNRAFWAFANPGLAAPASCPAIDYLGETTGLMSRAPAGTGGGRLGAGASAWQIFEAPAGARLESMSFRHSTARGSGCWSAGLFGWSGDAFHPGQHLFGAWGDCASAGGGFGWFGGPLTVDLRGHHKVRAGVRCESAAGCSTANGTWFNLKDVSVVVADDSAPSVAGRAGELLGDGWHRGTESAWADYADNVGIRQVYGQVDGGRASMSPTPAWRSTPPGSPTARTR